MAVLKLPDNTDNETIIFLRDVFDTFVPRNAEGKTIQIENGVFNFQNPNTIVYVNTPPTP